MYFILHKKTKTMKKVTKTRNQILAVASELFKNFGFDKTSIDDIAREAHKAKRSIYNHFAGKEELFAIIIGNEIAEVRTSLQPILDDTERPAADRLKEYMIRRMELINHAENYQQMLRNEIGHAFDQRFDNIRQLCRDFDEWERTQFKRIATDGAARRFAPDFNIDAFADMLLMVLKGLEISFFVQKNYAKYAATFSTFVGCVVESLIEQNKQKQL